MLTPVTQKRKRVLALSQYFQLNAMEGIADYARKAGWALDFSITSEHELNQNWQGDGILLIRLFHTEKMQNFINQSTLPTLIIGRKGWPGRKISRVNVDTTQVGCSGAEYFTSAGFKNLAILQCGNIPSEEQLAFEAVAHSRNCTLFSVKKKSISRDLMRAKKPLALMAPDDEWAVWLYQQCEQMGLLVPEQIAILGAGNSRHKSEFNFVPLSTIDTNFSQCAYRAAELLDKMMSGKPAPTEPLLISDNNIIVRESSSIAPVNDFRVGKAMKFINQHYATAINLDQVALDCGRCRWSLDLAFKKELDLSMSAYLMQQRMQHSQLLLQQNDLRINEIGRRVGYVNHVSFLRAFQRYFNCSPSAYTSAQEKKH